MAETLDIGDPPVRVLLRRNARAKRMTLRVSAADGTIRLTLPKRGSLRSAKRFLLEQECWLREQSASMPARIVISEGVSISLEGEGFTLDRHQGTRVIIAPGKIFLPISRPAGTALEAFIKARGKPVITSMVKADCTALGVSCSGISLRDPRSRWGSCNSEGKLMFSWRLFLAPPVVLRYVVAHEVAHLREMNHSSRFWAEVAGLMPEYEVPRQWLRQNGAHLHRFDFKSA